jgi:hypothetical protein
MSDGSKNDTACCKAVDAHGEAALTLVESLIHALVARSSLSLIEALDIVQVAIDVQIEISHDRGDDPAILPSVRFLQAISSSLKIDERQSDHSGLDTENPSD